jgi:hypothetical protein
MPSRARLIVLVISVKPPKSRTDPSGFKDRFDRFAPGLAKCGVLLKLNASARNCSLQRSRMANSRNMPKSQLTTPGPRIELSAAVPKRASVTGAKPGIEERQALTPAERGDDGNRSAVGAAGQ